MATLVEVRRVTVITDSVLESRLLESFVKLGAKGYNVVECRGKGQHGIVDDPLGGKSAEVRIEVIVQPDVAEKIMDYLQREVFQHYAVTAWLDSVHVSRKDRY